MSLISPVANFYSSGNASHFSCLSAIINLPVQCTNGQSSLTAKVLSIVNTRQKQKEDKKDVSFLSARTFLWENGRTVKWESYEHQSKGDRSSEVNNDLLEPLLYHFVE